MLGLFQHPLDPAGCDLLARAHKHLVRDLRRREAVLAQLPDEKVPLVAQVRRIGRHQQAVAVLRAEKQGLQIQVERTNGEAKEHLGEVYTLREQLGAAREMASREHMDAAMGADLLDKAEHENVRLDTRVTELEDENAQLRKQIEGSAGKNAGGRRKKP